MALSADGQHARPRPQTARSNCGACPLLELEHVYDPLPDAASVLTATGDGFVVARMDGGHEPVRIQRTVSPSGPAAATAAAVSPDNSKAPATLTETEPNNTAEAAMPVPQPAMVRGSVAAPGDADLFRFHARAGEALTLEVNAARSKAKLDSKLEILTVSGAPVEQVVLQATRDSWFTFRGKDSDTADDFRLHNWAEMELNEYLYAGGEVVKLWLYPRGPDSGYKVYPGSGKRQTSFGTPALVHPLGEPAWIVTPLPAGSQPAPNGLPVFRLNWKRRRSVVPPSRRFPAPVHGAAGG